MRRLLTLNLAAEGYDVRAVASAEEALALVQDEGFRADLVVLDIMLPGMDGYTLCQRLRADGFDRPIIMLTARSLKDDRIRGYDSGADAYLVKPFELDELLAVVRAQLRRAHAVIPPASPPVLRGRYRFGNADVNFDTFEVTVAGEPRKLTALELRLLKYFLDNPGRVLSRDELLRNVWGEEAYPSTRTVDNFVARLRKHFEPDPSNPRYFLSIRGAGYKFVPPESQR